MLHSGSTGNINFFSPPSPHRIVMWFSSSTPYPFLQKFERSLYIYFKFRAFMNGHFYVEVNYSAATGESHLLPLDLLLQRKKFLFGIAVSFFNNEILEKPVLHLKLANLQFEVLNEVL